MGTIVYVVFQFLRVLQWIILAEVVLSWVIRDPRNPVMLFLRQITEPMMKPIRELLYKLNIGGTMLDFSPMVAMILISVLQSAIVAIF